MSDREQTCSERVGPAWESTKEDLEALWAAYMDPDNENDEAEDLGSIFEYGLSFDWVPAGTFKGQEEGFFRYQFSWGGPSDEIRFYCGPDFRLHRAEYWFMDWFDGASQNVTGEEIIQALWDWFEGMDLRHYLEEAEV